MLQVNESSKIILYDETDWAAQSDEVIIHSSREYTKTLGYQK